MGSGAKSGSGGKSVEMSRADYEKRIAAELARIQGEIGILVKALEFLRTTATGKTIPVPRPILVVGPGCEATRVVKRGLNRDDLPGTTKGTPTR